MSKDVDLTLFDIVNDINEVKYEHYEIPYDENKPLLELLYVSPNKL